MKSRNDYRKTKEQLDDFSLALSSPEPDKEMTVLGQDMYWVPSDQQPILEPVVKVKEPIEQLF